jgi:hypothetical protein
MDSVICLMPCQIYGTEGVDLHLRGFYTAGRIYAAHASDLVAHYPEYFRWATSEELAANEQESEQSNA